MLGSCRPKADSRSSHTTSLSDRVTVHLLLAQTLTLSGKHPEATKVSLYTSQVHNDSFRLFLPYNLCFPPANPKISPALLMLPALRCDKWFSPAMLGFLLLDSFDLSSPFYYSQYAYKTFARVGCVPDIIDCSTSCRMPGIGLGFSAQFVLLMLKDMTPYALAHQSPQCIITYTLASLTTCISKQSRRAACLVVSSAAALAEAFAADSAASVAVVLVKLLKSEVNALIAISANEFVRI